MQQFPGLHPGYGNSDIGDGGEIDFEGSMNRKIDIMWADPSIVPRVEGQKP